jgi:hypothetical protein
MLLEADRASPRDTSADTVARATGALREEGYHVLRGAVARRSIQEMNTGLDDTFRRTPPSDGLFYGNWTRRFGGLLKRSPVAQMLTMHPEILRIAGDFLKPNCDRIQLSLMQAIELAPGAIAQVPHRDQESWGGEKGKFEYMVSVMWPLTPFTAENGATVVWPKSNRIEPDIDTVLAGGTPAAMDIGDALIFLGSTMHASGANRSNLPRRGLIISYCLGWLKPHENQWLVYPPAIARHFPPDLAALVGYCRHRPNLNNYEGQCPSILLKDDVPDFIAATDEFPDGLNDMIRAYRDLENTRSAPAAFT